MEIEEIEDNNIKNSSIIGKGAYGTVYKINDTNKIIKIMDTYYYVNTTDYKNLKLYQPFLITEMSNYLHLNKINNIGKFTNIYKSNTHINLEMDDLGLSLDKFINNYNISLDYIKIIMFKLSNTLLDSYNKFIIHCDIKPPNILIKNKNNSVDVNLIDFGLSRFVIDDDFNKVYDEIQTIWYRAPEQLLKSKDINSYKIDIWSLGIIFLELLFNKYGILNSTNEFTIIQYILAIIGLENISKNYLDILVVKYPSLNLNNYPIGNNLHRYLVKYTASPEYILIFDLLQNMLKFDPHDRYNYSQIINHKFFDSIRHLHLDIVAKEIPIENKLLDLEYDLNYDYIKKLNPYYIKNREYLCSLIIQFYKYDKLNFISYNISFCIKYLDIMASVEKIENNEILFFVIYAINFQKTIHTFNYIDIISIYKQFLKFRQDKIIDLEIDQKINENIFCEKYINICNKMKFNFNICCPICYEKLLENLVDENKNLIDNSEIIKYYRNIILKCQISDKIYKTNIFVLVQCCFILIYTKFKVSNKYIQNIFNNVTLDHSNIIKKIKNLIA